MNVIIIQHYQTTQIILSVQVVIFVQNQIVMSIFLQTMAEPEKLQCLIMYSGPYLNWPSCPYQTKGSFKRRSSLQRWFYVLLQGQYYLVGTFGVCRSETPALYEFVLTHIFPKPSADAVTVLSHWALTFLFSELKHQPCEVWGLCHCSVGVLLTQYWK